MSKNSQSDTERIPCDLCKKDETAPLLAGWDRLHGIPGEFTIVQCRHCQLVYLNPRPKRDVISKYYPTDYAGYAPAAPSYGTKHETQSSVRGRWLNLDYTASRQWFGYPANDAENFYQRNPLFRLAVKAASYPAAKSLSAWIVPYVRDGRVLDVGCGSGKLLNHFKSMGWQTFGVDFNPDAAAEARRWGHEVFCGQAEQAPFPEKYFDAITMIHSLEHVPNPLATAKLALRLLKPNGTLKVRVPNFGGLVARLFKGAWFQLDVPRHFYHFTPSTLSRLLETAGFSVTLQRTRTEAYGIVGSFEYRRRERKKPLSILHSAARVTCLKASWIANAFGYGDEILVHATPKSNATGPSSRVATPDRHEEYQEI